VSTVDLQAGTIDRDTPPLVKEFLRHYYMRYSGPAGMTASRGTIALRRTGAGDCQFADHRGERA
jgi:hypothetical protein